MYLLRATMASLAEFFLAYALLSAIVVWAWRTWGERYSRPSATILYAFRLLPLLGACGLVALLTVPSFLWLEPSSIEERIGIGAYAMASAGAFILLAGILNGARIWARASGFVNKCVDHSRRLEAPRGIRVYEVPHPEPVLFVGGIWRPKILVSTGALTLLDADELQAAIRHETAHIRRRDNLKKLALHFCRLPWLESLERNWLKAAELAADDLAAGDEETALDLASALIKMARASSRTTLPELGMALVSPNGACVSARVDALLSVTCSARRDRRLLWWALLVPAAVSVSLSYPWALALVHRATELVIR